jgi:predicted Zn-dependent peptidase
MVQNHYERFQMDVYSEKLDNGLTVYLIPKPGFGQVFSTFTTKYGSINRQFRVNHDANVTTVPDGIAHFLEHKMFEEEHGDVFNDFAVNGASANAFTSFDQTTYLFSCTDNVTENTKTLLDFVERPYFTVENVEKEKGIIGQEIRMYDDNPDWRGFFGLLRAMYENHPVRIDIAGTIESIAKITKDTLYHCYHTFYHPSNMIYVATGGFDPLQLMEVIKQNQAAKSFDKPPVIEHVYPVEAGKAFQSRSVVHLGVAQPRCLIGWKDSTWGKKGSNLLHQELLTGLILDTLFGRSSPLYDELIESQLIDQQFSWEYEISEAFGYSMVGGNTTNPDKLVARIEQELSKTLQNGIDETDFERSRKKAIGRFLSGLDQTTYIGRSFTSYALKDVDFFETVDILEKLTLKEAHDRFREHFVADQQSVSIVASKT